MNAPLKRNGVLVTTIERSCESKKRYPDEFVARGIGQILGEAKGLQLYVYPCKLCKGWHLTRRNNGRKSAANYQFDSPPR